MESLNMNTLASSLPNSAHAEKQLMDNFKAAALSITTLYRSSLDASKQAYSSGYATCLLDVLHFVEAGVSVSGDGGEEMTIGKVMDWVEARLEAVKSGPEDEDEDRERMKDGGAAMCKVSEEEAVKEEKRGGKKGAGGGAASGHGAGLSRGHRRSKESLREVLPPPPPPPPPAVNGAQQASLAHPTSTSSPPRSFTSPSPTPPPIRPIRSKRGLKDLNNNTNTNTTSDLHQHHLLPVALTPNTAAAPFTFSPDVVSALPPPLPPAMMVGMGHKRRHAAMLADSQGPSGADSTPAAYGHGHGHGHARRKRGRGARDGHAGQQGTHASGMGGGNGNGSQGQTGVDAMEVEEEGRERKRVTRR